MDKEKAKQVSSVWLRSPATTKTESFDLIRNLYNMEKRRFFPDFDGSNP
jgi:hypothetical protein